MLSFMYDYHKPKNKREEIAASLAKRARALGSEDLVASITFVLALQDDKCYWSKTSAEVAEYLTVYGGQQNGESNHMFTTGLMAILLTLDPERLTVFENSLQDREKERASLKHD